MICIVLTLLKSFTLIEVGTFFYSDFKVNILTNTKTLTTVLQFQFCFVENVCISLEHIFQLLYFKINVNLKSDINFEIQHAHS